MIRYFILFFLVGITHVQANNLKKDITFEKEPGKKIKDNDSISIYPANPFYWQYKGEPILLLGGTKDDNLFQIPDLEAHLDELVENGGNYIRNVMSSRPDGGFEVRPHQQLSNRKYDLTQWNEEYWTRFENLLRWTEERDIIVQIEIWAFHDLFNTKRHPTEWKDNPWNPDNNINYSTAQTILKSNYTNNNAKHDFFYTVPNLDNDEKVLKFQKLFVDKILDYSLNYGHVLYCMTNEIHANFSPEWGWYWSKYIKQRASEQGKVIYTTEMYQKKQFDHPQHKGSFDHPEIYDYIETSQNSGWKDQDNWDNLQYARNYIAAHPRPLNAVKIYGRDYADERPWAGNSNDAVERFWRNILGGNASSRFHRPVTGLGLSDLAKGNLRAMREFIATVKPWEAEPRNDLLSERTSDEAYLMAKPGEFYGLYLTNGGGVDLDLTDCSGTFKVKWIRIDTGDWHSEETIQGGEVQRIQAPASSGWAAVVVRE